jgi:hypothetical protein
VPQNGQTETVTESEWLTSLADLRAGGGECIPYLVRWWPYQRPALELGFVSLVRRWGAEIEGSFGKVERYDVALYSPEARPGSDPLVLVPIGAHEPVGRLSQGERVLVRGDVEAGGAVVIEGADQRFDPIGPCNVPAFRRRRYRL